MESIHCCIDRTAPPRRLREDVRERLAQGHRAGTHERASALTSSLWTPHQTITVAFLRDRGGTAYRRDSADIEQRLQRIAAEWTRHANLVLAFVEGPATIRIAFEDGGSWSYIGRQCLEIPTDRATMNFGWLSRDLAEREFRRVVLHEFGHALGLVHEHQHPAGGIQWKRSAVTAFYQGPPNHWSEQDIEHNLYATYAAELTQHTKLDRRSIMMYPIPAEFTEDGYSVGWNDELSELDSAFISRLYPR